jgi:Peptide N-acetyl-beta-D-glucosaminyl asparaginase amidase A
MSESFVVCSFTGRASGSCQEMYRYVLTRPYMVVPDLWFQVITDPSGKQTTGKITRYDVSPFGHSSSSASLGSNGDINITVQASRSLTIEADVKSGSGSTTHVVWQQDLSYSNTQFYMNNFSVQNVVQSSTGQSSSKHDGKTLVQDTFSFPMEIDFTGVQNGCQSSYSAPLGSTHHNFSYLLLRPFIQPRFATRTLDYRIHHR